MSRLSASQWMSVTGVGGATARHLCNELNRVNPTTVLESCRQAGLTLLVWGDADYPPLLREIPDPPPLLFARGRLDVASSPCVAVVGSRHMSNYGERATRRLTEGLVQAGVVIVSGLARGVDRVAHETALAAGGKTIAVMGSGHNNIYPSEHRGLAQAIADDGVLLSEYAPQVSVKSSHFPQRNRTIAGLSLGVLVVEAALRSGALITARLAVEQNRDVFAVPGPIDNRMSRGCHALIKDGAKLAETAEDILEELGTPRTEICGRPIAPRPIPAHLSQRDRQVLALVNAEPTLLDDVVARAGLEVPSVLASIFVLESEGLIRRTSGGTVARSS